LIANLNIRILQNEAKFFRVFNDDFDYGRGNASVLRDQFKTTGAGMHQKIWTAALSALGQEQKSTNDFAMSASCQ
jgi:hypothetical protein